MTAVAKIFRTGGSQAVRLPAEFRFEVAEVFVTRLASGDLVLSTRVRGDWAEFMKTRRELVPGDELNGFLTDREQPPAQERATLQESSKKPRNRAKSSANAKGARKP